MKAQERKTRACSCTCTHSIHTHAHYALAHAHPLHAQLGSELVLQQELNDKQQEQTSRVRQLDMLRGSRGTHEQNRDRALSELRVR